MSETQSTMTATGKVESNRRRQELAEAPVGKLMWVYALPAVAGTMMDSIYTLIDGIFIGQGIGTVGLSALAITFPLYLLLVGTSLAIGVGTASIVSRALGRGDEQLARQAVGTALGTIVVVSLLFLLAGTLFIDPLLRFLAADGLLLEVARDYQGTLFAGAFAFCLANVGQFILRADGRPNQALAMVAIGTVFNLILDAVFIFVFGWGMMGAALATVISAAAAAFLAIISTLEQSTLVPRWKELVPDWRIFVEMVQVGSSLFGRLFAAVIANVFINNILMQLGGPNHLAVLSMVYRIMIFAYMPLYGISQGLQPLVGYNYGAGNYERVRSTFGLSLGVAVAYCSVAFILLYFFSGPVLSLFGGGQELVERGTPIMHIMIILFPIVGVTQVITGAFQAIGDAVSAFLVSVAQPLSFTVIILLFAQLFGIRGVWFSWPASEFVAFIVGYLLVMLFVRRRPHVLRVAVAEQ